MKAIKRYISTVFLFALLITSIQAQNIECIGNTIEIPLTGSRNESVQWQFSTNEVDWINLPGANSVTLVYPVVETGYFRARVIYGDCEYFSDTTYIEAFPEPTIANTGADQNIITSETTSSLYANNPKSGTGKWSLVSGGTGSFSDEDDPTATFTGSQCADYVLRWTISTECNYSSDDVNIGFHALPTTANAGADQTKTNADISVNLSANTPVVGTGKWTVISGGTGSFANDMSPVTSFTGSQCNDYILCWTISTDCKSSSDSVNIGFHATPTTANAGADKNIMDGSTSLILNANTPVIGAGLWAVKTGPLGTFNNSQIPNATFSGILDNKYTLTWTISTGCNSNIDEVNINIYNPANIVLDFDGNIYKTVNIGTQLWMAENLKTTSFKDGASIPLVSDNTAWAGLVTPGYCWYSNNASYKDTYGALYNWYTVITSTLCPGGWHIPSDAEWTTLIDYLGGPSIAGGKLKETLTTHWNSPNTGATNETGFTALPGSYREYNGNFGVTREYGGWWSSTEDNTGNAWRRGMWYNIRNVSRHTNNKQFGFSVRCVKDDLPTVTTNEPSAILATSATCGGNVTFDGGAPITVRGVCWSTSPNPTVTLSAKTSDGTGTGIFISALNGLIPNTIYYVRAYAINSAGITYGNEKSFATRGETGTVIDIVGNIYQTIKIGPQTWMAENLKTHKFNDSTDIQLIASGVSWSTSSTSNYCWYGNDLATYKDTYGALYNWYSVINGKLCPKGWHVPADPEWTALMTYLGGTTIAGGKLKETGTLHWPSPNTVSTNSSGFTALPGGYRNNDGAFSGIGEVGSWWSATETNINDSSYWLLNTSIGVTMTTGSKKHGFSVRCLKD